MGRKLSARPVPGFGRSMASIPANRQPFVTWLPRRERKLVVDRVKANCTVANVRTNFGIDYFDAKGAHMKHRMQPWVRKSLAAAVTMACAHGAQAIEFETGGGISGSLNTTLSFSQAWRAEEGNVGIAPDHADKYNFKKNDPFSQLFKINAELLMNKGDTGIVMRAKAWYDNVLNSEEVAYGNQANRFNHASSAQARLGQSGAPSKLSDEGQDALAKYDGIELLDFYGYTSFAVAGRDVQVRLGSQAINWGESVFVQGINVMTPRRPAPRRHRDQGGAGAVLGAVGQRRAGRRHVARRLLSNQVATFDHHLL